MPDADKLSAKYTLPPEGLPQRHLFWREEMADNAIEPNKEGEAGVKTPLDWYRFKANQMSFLGMNTYTKDLLEFGAVQHWDTTAHGGNSWAYFRGDSKDLWRQIVEVMGQRGFTVLPYYEYSGSKGEKGLGNERRAKPLTRDDAFSHIKWIDLCIDRVRINNREAEDGDGLTLDGCRGVRVAGCDITAGRDAMCIHSSRADRPAVNAIISDCVLSGRSSAIRVGLLSVGMIDR